MSLRSWCPQCLQGVSSLEYGNKQGVGSKIPNFRLQMMKARLGNRKAAQSYGTTPLFVPPNPKHTPSPWGEQPFPPHRKFPAPLSTYAHPTELRAPGTQKKSIPQLADESSSASSLYPQNPLLELELLSVLPVFSLKTLNYLRIKKAKSQRHLLLPYFPCSGCCLNLLYLEKRFNCNPANIFGEHSKAWSRTTVVTPKHAEGGGTVWLSAVFWGFFLPYSLQQQWRIQKGKSRVVSAC